MKLGLFILLFLGSKDSRLDLPKDMSERCRLVLATAAGALGKPEAPNFCGGASYSAYGRVIVDAKISRTSGDAAWYEPAFRGGTVCRDDFIEVYQPSRWRKRWLPPDIVDLSFEMTKEPSTYRFGAGVSSSTRKPNEGSIMLCGGASGVVRKKGKTWVVELDKDEDSSQ